MHKLPTFALLRGSLRDDTVIVGKDFGRWEKKGREFSLHFLPRTASGVKRWLPYTGSRRIPDDIRLGN
jgi:hypothetical protein